MAGEVIAVFSCLGKSHFVHKYYKKFDCVDHDLYDFKFAGSKEVRANWLDLYLKRARFLQNKYSIVFVNATPEILEKLPSTVPIIYPSRGLKDAYVERARARGATEFFKLLSEEWNTWIDACENHPSKFKYELRSGDLFLTEWMTMEMYENGTGIEEFRMTKYHDALYEEDE